MFIAVAADSGSGRDYPQVRPVTIDDLAPAAQRGWSQQYGMACAAVSLEAVLEDPGINAIHLVMPITLHARFAGREG